MILGILAAIAIPALTGYISKAEDKQYEMEARDASVAVRTILDEAWASGEINDVPYTVGTNQVVRGKSPLHFFETGFEHSDSEIFSIQYISRTTGHNDNGYFERAAALMGEPYAVPANVGSERLWGYWTFAQKGSGATAASADGFAYVVFPKGISNPPFVAVTYRLSRVDVSTYNGFANTVLGTWSTTFGTYTPGNAHYDASAGYEVYHLTSWS